jgi:hypothetical protein
MSNKCDLPSSSLARKWQGFSDSKAFKTGAKRSVLTRLNASRINFFTGVHVTSGMKESMRENGTDQDLDRLMKIFENEVRAGAVGSQVSATLFDGRLRLHGIRDIE